MEMSILTPLILGVAAVIGGAAGYFISRKTAVSVVAEAEKRADTITASAKTEAEALRKEAVVEGKEALQSDRAEFEREVRAEQQELRKREEQLNQRESDLDRRRERLDHKEESIERRAEQVSERLSEAEQKQAHWQEHIQELDRKLEEVGRMNMEEARQELLRRTEETAKLDAARLARHIEEEAKEEAEVKAKKIIAESIQRYAGEYITERAVTVVPIPDDKMKGRIIGREGRNIRSFEMIAGVDLIVDESPEHVVISCHDPLRRQVARIALERLMEDGRIQPGRIEEIYQAVAQDLEREIRDEGQKSVFNLGLQGLHNDLVRLMGINKFRTSYAQNILHHSEEVGFLAGMMADELGLDRQLARRCGFLHDIGKAVDHEFEGGHAQIGADLCKKFGEDEDVVKAVAEHHDDHPSTVYGILTQAADALSAARPGARRESLANHIKRLDDLEQVATRYPEVNRAFAIQAGRELRVMLDSERVDDDGAFTLAKAIAAEIESDMNYPGQIKVTVMREMRATAYAK